MPDRTITMDEVHYAAATRAVERDGFQSVAEYISKLIDLDQLAREGAIERHEALLRETLEKNQPPTEFTQADWDELRERAKRVASTTKRATA